MKLYLPAKFTYGYYVKWIFKASPEKKLGWKSRYGLIIIEAVIFNFYYLNHLLYEKKKGIKYLYNIFIHYYGKPKTTIIQFLITMAITLKNWGVVMT